MARRISNVIVLAVVIVFASSAVSAATLSRALKAKLAESLAKYHQRRHGDHCL